MSTCSYLSVTDEEHWCELSEGLCPHEGSLEKCALDTKSIAAAVREQKKASLSDAAIRARKHFSDRIAS